MLFLEISRKVIVLLEEMICCQAWIRRDSTTLEDMVTADSAAQSHSGLLHACEVSFGRSC